MGCLSLSGLSDPPESMTVPLPIISLVEQTGPPYGVGNPVLLPTITVEEQPPVNPATIAQLQEATVSRAVAGFAARWRGHTGWKDGTLRMRLSRSGVFTGIVHFGKQRVPFSGRFDAGGAFQKNIQTTAGPLRVRFQIVTDNARLWLAGSFERSGSVFGPLEFEGLSFGVNSR